MADKWIFAWLVPLTIFVVGHEVRLWLVARAIDDLTACIKLFAKRRKP